MPLYKRKLLPLLEPPDDLDPQELVFQVRFTKEIFRDYEGYLEKLNLYRQRVWTCKVTGKSNLTYEEALVSERRATEKVQQFPEDLVAPVLNMIQFSTANLTDLVNEIYDELQEDLFEGLHLQGRKEESVCSCEILKILDDGDIIQYQVGWLDKDEKVTDTSVVKAEDLIRKRPLSRRVLKAFIRNSTCQSSPWMIHEKLAEKHSISTTPPEELMVLFTIENGRVSVNKKKDPSRKKTWDVQDAESFELNKKRKKTENGNEGGRDVNKKIREEEENPVEKPIRYPIDDLLVQPAPDDPVFTKRPSPCSDFTVPMSSVGDLLMIWDFCCTFGKLLRLSPFTLEDFENAINHKDSNLILIVEIHSAVLNLLMKDEGDYFLAIQSKKRKSKIMLTNWAEFLCDFLTMEDGAALTSHLTTIRRGYYSLLDANVKLSILRELVSAALTTNAVREKLDDCMEQQQALAAEKRDEFRKKKEEKQLRKEDSEKKTIVNGKISQNGDRNMSDSVVDDMAHLSKKNHILENGRKKHEEPNLREAIKEIKVENGSSVGSMKGQRAGKNKDYEAQEKIPEDRMEHLQREIEKLSIRTNSLGKDRNYNRYWFFRREGRLFVESSDSNKWGYYTTKDELDALMGSLNPKGQRERALQKQLEKNYDRISTALQKRSKGINQKILLEENVLRRSTRVRAQPRESSALAFLRYVNKWKEK